MKKILMVLAGFVLFSSLAGTAQAAFHSFDYAAGLSPTQTVDKTQLEGWVVKVDYRQNSIRLLDPRGFERIVTVRRGTIGGYRRGDYLKVSIDREREWLSQVEKV